MEENILIIANGYVITCDPAHRGGSYSLLIRDGRIGGIAEGAESLLASHPRATVVDAKDKLILPGFVNAHSHSESMLFKPLTDGRPLAEWSQHPLVRELHVQLARAENNEDLRVVYQAAYLAHLKSGTTCVGEYSIPVGGRGLQTIGKAIEQTGVKGRLVLQNKVQIDHARLLPREHQKFTIGLGREEDFTAAHLHHHGSAAAALHCPVMAHVAESSSDGDIVKRRYARNTIDFLCEHRLLGENTLLAHCNHASPEEIDCVRRHGATVILSPRSAAFKQTGYPVLRHLASHNGRLCIGTDWGSTDMLAEMKFLLQLPLLFQNVCRFSPADLIRMGTINAAHALQMADDIGSLEPGKRADLVLFSLRDIRLPFLRSHPSTDDLARLLVAECTTRDISDVMIDGNFCMANGRVTILDEHGAAAAFRRVHEKWHVDRGSRSPHHAESFSGRSSSLPGPGIRTFSDSFHDVNAGDVEEGFSIVGKISSTDQPSGPLPLSSTVPVVKPELPKDVKKVFGEDDEM